MLAQVSVSDLLRPSGGRSDLLSDSSTRPSWLTLESRRPCAFSCGGGGSSLLFFLHTAVASPASESRWAVCGGRSQRHWVLSSIATFNARHRYSVHLLSVACSHLGVPRAVPDLHFPLPAPRSPFQCPRPPVVDTRSTAFSGSAFSSSSTLLGAHLTRQVPGKSLPDSLGDPVLEGDRFRGASSYFALLTRRIQ